MGAAVVTVVVFLPAARGGFVWDDAGLITQRHDTLDQWSDVIDAFSRAATAGEGVAYYRPTMIASFVADSQLAGDFEATTFHRTNVLLHGLNVALIAILLAVYGCGPWAMGITALLFGLHPLQCQAVALILGRNDLLLVPPVVGMLLADEMGRRRGTRRLADALIVLCFALTLWTKETGIVAPLFLVAVDLGWHRRPLSAVRDRIPLFLALAVVVGLYFATRLAVIGSVLDVGQYGYVAPLARMPLAIAIFGHYVRHVVMPWGMAPAPYHPGLVDPHAPDLWIAAAFVVGFLLATAFAARRAPRVAVGLVIFAAALLPVLGVVAAMKVFILDHRTYLAMLGIAVAVSALPVVTSTVTGRVAAVVALGILAILTHRRLPAFGDSVSLWALGVEAAPSSDYARNNYAAALMDADRYHEAIIELREALRLNPGYDKARFNLAGCLEYVGERGEAMREIELLAERRPNDVAVLSRLGFMRSRAGDVAGATAAFERAVAAKPDDRTMLRNLADFLDRQNAAERAVPWRRRLVELDPENAAAWTALARSLAAANQAVEAVPTFERALQIGPETGQLHAELARALFPIGRWKEAALHLERARALGVVDPLLTQRLTEVGVFGP